MASFVWKSFGLLLDKSGKCVDPEHIHCIHCFESGQPKYYKETVSMTNLAIHLRETHSIL